MKRKRKPKRINKTIILSSNTSLSKSFCSLPTKSSFNTTNYKHIRIYTHILSQPHLVHKPYLIYITSHLHLHHTLQNFIFPIQVQIYNSRDIWKIYLLSPCWYVYLILIFNGVCVVYLLCIYANKRYLVRNLHYDCCVASIYIYVCTYICVAIVKINIISIYPMHIHIHTIHT